MKCIQLKSGVVQRVTDAYAHKKCNEERSAVYVPKRMYRAWKESLSAKGVK